MTTLAEPALGSPAMFDGALIELYSAKVLVVRVRTHVIMDAYESQLLVIAFHVRFRRTIVLVAVDDRGRPTYFGPDGIVRVLGGIPIDALSWRRYRYRREPPPMLPIPQDYEAEYTRTTSFERPLVTTRS